MKRLILTTFTLVIFALTAGTTTEIRTFTGSATNQHPFHVLITTLRDGDVTANVQWVPKNGQQYVLHLKRLTNPNDPFSYTHICIVDSTQTNPSAPPPGNWTCTEPDGPAGFWTVDFRPTSGKVSNVTVTTTAETDE